MTDNRFPPTPGLAKVAARIRAARIINARPPQSYRIRRCHGDKAAWCLIRLRADGSESDSYGSYTTSSTLDGLLRGAGHLLPLAGDHVDFVA